MLKNISFETLLPVVKDWFGSIYGEEDCENIAQEFAIGLSDDEDCFYLLDKVSVNYGFDPSEFEGICIDLYEIIEKEEN
jgi:hypothetical protein